MKRLLLVGLIVFMPGCATTFTGICMTAPLGITDTGIPALAVHCEATK